MNRLLSIMLVLCFLLLSGCAGRNMARINDSTDAEHLFTGWPLPENYEYYYYGRETSPTAFLAVDKSYTLESDFWVRISPTTKIRDVWQGQFSIRNFTIDKSFRGKEIIAPDGGHIGMAYSRNHWVTAWVTDENPKQIVVPPPQPSPAQERPGKDNSGNN